MYDINSDDSTPVINYEGVSKNVAAVGFQEDGKWMYTGGEDCTARIWDLRYGVCYDNDDNQCYQHCAVKPRNWATFDPDLLTQSLSM